MTITLAEFLREPENAQRVAVKQCLQCRDCAEDLAPLMDRHSEVPEYAYAACCRHHAPYIRAIIDPPYLAFVQREVDRLTGVYQRIQEYMDVEDRINRGVDILKGDVPPDKLPTYQARLRELERQKERLGHVHLDSLAQVMELCEYYQEIVRLALAFEETCIV